MLTALLAGVGLLVAGAPSSPASAADSSAFDPGYIISDEKFHDSSSMSASQIQSFLNSRVPTCSSGYTCLKDFRQTTWTRAADAQCASYAGRADETAAEIIYRVGQACGINPQVLLVLLQKEQTLVTSTAPTAYKYNTATGYACPDTAPCDLEFAGFYNQVYKAAWQYRRYEVNKFAFGYFPVGQTTNIQYHPRPECGTQRVYIQNQATANLYYYTPYVPNAAALGNLYGTGDGCSAYGNRNFWRIFTDWFGAPSSGRSTHGSFDTAGGVQGGIEVTGWSLDPFTDVTVASFIWINVDGSGGPAIANQPLNWIDGLYPGAGPNHGFDLTVPASPGNHTVCVHGTNSALLGCKQVTVPQQQSSVGRIESVTGVIGAIEVTGWSLDTNSNAPTYVWVNVDGSGGPAFAGEYSAAAATAYPALGANHGFSARIPAGVGRHEVCVFGVNSAPLGCRTVFVPDSAAGGFDSAAGVVGGIQVSGWSLDRATADSTYAWVNVNGSGGPLYANQALPWIATAYPGLGENHGFSATIPAARGLYQVCVFGTNSIALGCKNVEVPSAGDGSFDSITAVPGGARVTGWTVDRTRSDSVFIWINVDGKGGPAVADVPLNWIDLYYPGTGPNHGFDTVVPMSPGAHEVCIFGHDAINLGCKQVTVTQ